MNVSKTNGVKLLAVVAVLAMALCVFAAVPADETDAAPSAIPTEIGGGITPSTTSGAYVLQTYTSGEVIVISDFVIPNNTALVVAGTAKFVVNEGVTITIEEGGQLVLSGTADVTINGDIIAEGTDADADKTGYYGAIINNVKTGAAPSTAGVKVNGNITLERGAEMVFDKTNTIGKDSQIFALSTGVDSGTAAGEIVLNEGASLNVTKSSSYISIISTQKVSIGQGATFTVNGYAIDVNVVATGSSTTYTAGSMTIDSGFEYADLSKLAGNRDVSNLTFTVTTQNVSAFTTNDAETADRVTLRQYVLNVDGTVDGTIVKVSGVDTLYAGKLTIGVEAGTPYYAVKEDGTPGTQIQPINSITGTLNVTELGSIEIKGYLSVSGTLAVDYDADTKTGSGNTTAIPKNVTFSTGAYVNVTGAVSINDAANAVTPTAGTIYIDGGSIDLTNVDGGFITTLATGMQVYGAAYLIEGTGANSEDSLHFRDLSVAVTEGATAGAKEMWVLSLTISANPNTATTVDAAIENGAYVIDEDISIPDGVTLTIEDAIAIADGATLTFEAGSEYDSNADGTTTKCIFVGGKLVDMDGLFERSEGVLKFEVKKLSEDETVATYTTLKIALGEAQPGETIELNDKIVITENLIIPADVTVVSDTEGIEVQDATLTVNGVLDMDSVDITFADNVNGNNNGVAEGSVIVNNYIVNAGATNFITYDEAGTSIAAANKIAGAHFTGAVDDYDENTTVISTVAIAAAATTDNIVVFGNVSMGDVTFTAPADDTLAVYIVNDKDDAKEIARAGTVTLSGAVTINTYDGDFSGTITGADASIALEKNRDMLISVSADESGESVVYNMEIQSENASTTAQWADGTVTIVSGTVTVSDDLTINVVNVDSGATLVIAEGAVLTTGCSDFKTNTIAKELPIVTESLIGNLSGLNIDGTVTVQKTASINAPVSVIDGTVSIEKGAAESTFAISVINGTLTVDPEATNVSYMTLLVNGTITGNVDSGAVIPYETTEATGNTGNLSGLIGIIAFPSADLSGAEIDFFNGTESTAVSTTYYVNGAEYATVYAADDTAVDMISLVMEIPGYQESTAVFYNDADMRQVIVANEDLVEIPTNFNTTDVNFLMKSLSSVIATLANPTYAVGDYESVYVSMDPATVSGTITSYAGLSVYIDGLSLSNIDNTNGKYNLSVGTHEISVQIQPGYAGTTQVSVNGTVITGNTFEITGDMSEFQIVVTGEIAYDTGSTGGDDGMGLTEILLIILVVLIVVMAIMVALRLMRS